MQAEALDAGGSVVGQLCVAGVFLISQDAVADMLAVNAELMGPTGVQRRRHERRRCSPCQHFETGEARFSVIADLHPSFAAGRYVLVQRRIDALNG